MYFFFSYFHIFSNPNLTHLPPKLGLLKNIWSLNLSGLEIDNVPDKLDGKKNIFKIFSYCICYNNNLESQGFSFPYTSFQRNKLVL